ncbi:methyl-accepting chemotaxis protein, partial [Campylobacter lari]|nr:methyl-accepting chemotaxis protein [Campylobacter lari]
MKINSIVSKVNILVGLLFLIAIILIGSVSYFQSKKSSFEYLRENHNKVLFDVGYIFNTYEADNKSSIKFLAETIAKGKILENEQEIFDTLKLTKEFVGFDLVFLTTENNGITYDSNGNKRTIDSGFDGRTRPWYIG